MKLLFVLNDPPYGTERGYNALRLANALLKKNADAEITVSPMANAVIGAKAAQKTPDGYYNIERMLEACAHRQRTGPAMRHLHRCPRSSRYRDRAGPSAAPWTRSPPRCWRPTRCWCSDRLPRKAARDDDNLSSCGQL